LITFPYDYCIEIIVISNIIKDRKSIFVFNIEIYNNDYYMSRTLLSILLFLLLGTFTFTHAQDEPDKDFDSFLKKFTTSAQFQYSRIKFPIATSIYLLNEDGEEIEVPFTADEWPLLEESDFHLGRIETMDGTVFGKYSTKEPKHVVFESGLEESELDLIVTFDLVDGKWYMTDCYTGWYGSLPAEDFESTVYEVQQKNIEFEKKYP